jgi:hypothetical protein
MRGLRNINLKLVGAYLIFAFIFFLFYGFYLFYLNVPGFSNDSVQYFHAAFSIVEGKIPLVSLPVNIPIGYPAFMSIFLSLGLDIVFILYVQIALQFVASLILIRQIFKLNPIAGLVFSVFLSIWITDPHVMNYNSYFYPDSLFATALLLVVSASLMYFRKSCVKHVIFLFLSVMLVVLIRSNGLFILIIPCLLIVRAIIQRKFQHVLVLLSSGLLTLLLISSVNYRYKDYFFPGDYKRIVQVFNQFNEHENDTPEINRSQMFVDYLFHTKQYRPSFYYTRLPFNYQKYKHNKMCLDNYCTDNADFIHMDSPENSDLNIHDILLKTYNNHHYKDYSKFDIQTLTDFYERPRHPLLWFIHAVYHVLYLSFFCFPFILILFLLSSLLSIVKSFQTKARSHAIWLVIAIISSMHWLSIITLTFAHHRIQPRYIIVSEFIIYLTVVLTIFVFSSSIKRGFKLQL